MRKLKSLTSDVFDADNDVTVPSMFVTVVSKTLIAFAFVVAVFCAVVTLLLVVFRLADKLLMFAELTAIADLQD